MIVYILQKLNKKNNFSFSENYKKSYKSKNQFYRDRKKLLENQVIFTTDCDQIYTLNVDIYNQLTLHQEQKLREEQKKQFEKYLKEKEKKNE